MAALLAGANEAVAQFSAGASYQPPGAYYSSVANQMAGAAARSPYSAPAGYSIPQPVPTVGPASLSARPNVAQLTAAAKQGRQASSQPAGAPLRFPAPAPTATSVRPASFDGAGGATATLQFPTTSQSTAASVPPATGNYRAVTPYGAAVLTASQPMPAPAIPGISVPPLPGGGYGNSFGSDPMSPAFADGIPPAGGATTVPPSPTPAWQSMSPWSPSWQSSAAGGPPPGAPFGGGSAPLSGGSGFGGCATCGNQGGAGCDPGVYDPGIFDPGWRGCGPWFVSVSGLIMARGRPNNVGLAFATGVPQINILNTERAGPSWNGGFETRFGRMFGQNWAVEAVYWMLDPTHDNLTVRNDANVINSRLDFQNLVYEGTPLSTIFDNSHEQRLYRWNRFQNIEINLAQQALVVDPAGRFGMSYFTGVRYFQFEEVLHYSAVAAGAEFSDMDEDTQTLYDIHTRNQLTGWQLGARGHVYLGNRVRLFATPRFGLFGNHISQRQIVCELIDINARKNDVALLGQLDLGIAAQVFRCWSVFVGYRALGIAGVATADDNIARTFLSQPAMASINSSSSLILHGAQAGVQVQF